MTPITISFGAWAKAAGAVASAAESARESSPIARRIRDPPLRLDGAYRSAMTAELGRECSTLIAASAARPRASRLPNDSHALASKNVPLRAPASPAQFSDSSPRTAGPQPRDVLRLALRRGEASEGGRSLPPNYLCGDVALEEIARAESGIALGRRPVAAPARHEELDQIARLQDLLRLGVLGRPAIDQKRPPGPGPASEETLGRDRCPVAENGAGRRLVGEDAKAHDLAKPAAEAAVAARAVTQRLALDEERGERLHDLDGRAEHAGREGGGGETVLGRARARAARAEEGVDEGLLPLVLARKLYAPDIGRAFGHDLIGQRLLERPRQHVGQEVADHVPGGHGRGVLHVEDASLGRRDAEHAEGALVVRHVGADDDLDAVGRIGLGVVHDDVDAAPARGR